MKYEDLVNPNLLNQPVYKAGKPISHVVAEYGLEPNGVIQLASNESALGPSPMAIEAVRHALMNAHRYGDGSCLELREKLAKRMELTPNQFIIGNGSNELMVLICQALLVPGDEVVVGSQAFIMAKIIALMFGARPIDVPMPNFKHELSAMADAITKRTKLVYFPHPNNPTGDVQELDVIEGFVKRLPPHVVLLIDEAYVEYLENPPDFIKLLNQGHKIICCRTFSKAYGLAGFRIGYAYGDVEFIKLINRIKQPFNVNALAQVAAIAALDDVEFIKKNVLVSRRGQQQLSQLCEKLGLQYLISSTNFGLLKVLNSQDVYRRLQSEGVITRPLDVYGMPQYLRITVGTEEQNQRLIKCLKAIF